MKSPKLIAESLLNRRSFICNATSLLGLGWLFGEAECKAQPRRRITSDDCIILRRNAEMLGFLIEGVRPGNGHIGLEFDLLYRVGPGNGPDAFRRYNPSKNPNDPYNAACQFGFARGYYRQVIYEEGDATFRHGIRIYNKDKRRQGDEGPWIEHFWPRKIHVGHLEIYPEGRKTYDVGCVRLEVHNWHEVSGNRWYSPRIGVIDLPTRKSADRINGYIYENRRRIEGQAGRFEMRAFGVEGGARTNTGYRYMSFASIANDEGGSYYESGPLLPGRYTGWAKDHRTEREVTLKNIKVPVEPHNPINIDFDNQRTFGLDRWL